MTLITLGEAEKEFAESVNYYESKETGLGARFRDEIVEAVDRISAPSPILHGWQFGANWSSKRPMLLPLGSFIDPPLQQCFLLFG